ncbi:MAG: protein phosphatase 2C domain-containing protein, partial [Bacteroidota bacterium]
MTAAGLTHPGLRRDHNEDRYVCDAERGLFVVIDGVGGYASGDVAAELARDLVYQRLRRHQGPSTVRLREAITVANNEIYYRSQLDPAQWGMACVLTAVVVEPGMATVGHVGDTRLYEVRREGLRKVTADHSPVGLREDQGELSEVEAMAHPRRSEILRDVGSTYHHTDDADFVDVYRVPFHADRALLLCSDGLTDLVPSAEIHRLLMLEAGRPDRAAQRLIDAATDAGGHDNITAVVIEGAEYAARVQHADARPGLGPRSRRGRWSWFAAGLLLGL